MKLPPGFISPALDETALSERSRVIAHMEKQKADLQAAHPEKQLLAVTFSRLFTTEELAVIPEGTEPGIALCFAGSEYRLLAVLCKVERVETGYRWLEPGEKSDVWLLILFRTDGTTWPNEEDASMTEISDVPAGMDMARLPDHVYMAFVQGLLQSEYGKQLLSEAVAAKEARKWEL